MHTTPLKNELENYGKDVGVLMKIDRSESRELIAKEADCAYAERTQTKVQTQIEESYVEKKQIGNSAASNGA